MKKLLSLIALSIFALTSVAFAAPISYDLQLTTNYQFGGCDFNGICASPIPGSSPS